MNLISVKTINKPRKERICEGCYKPIIGSQLRLFGSAEKGDKPYTIYIHHSCGLGKAIQNKLKK